MTERVIVCCLQKSVFRPWMSSPWLHDHCKLQHVAKQGLAKTKQSFKLGKILGFTIKHVPRACYLMQACLLALHAQVLGKHFIDTCNGWLVVQLTRLFKCVRPLRLGIMPALKELLTVWPSHGVRDEAGWPSVNTCRLLNGANAMTPGVIE